MPRRSYVLLGIVVCLLAGWWAWQVFVDPQIALPSSPGPVPGSASRVVPDGGAAQRGSGSSVERVAIERAAQVPAAAAPCLEFRITGVAPGECRGTLEVSKAGGGLATQPILQAEISLPLAGDMRRVVFEVDGYCIAEFFGPFVERDEPIDVALRRAGTILVDVLDGRGNPLEGRLVFCHPIEAAPADGLIAYRTTQWGTTNERGRATIRAVVPGSCSLVTRAIAEWQEATISGVQVTESTVTSARMTVPVLDPGGFGAFTLDVESAGFLEATPSGVVRNYCFWTAEGERHEIYRMRRTLRCIVPGELGGTVSGRIEWRSSHGTLQLPSWQSAPIRVTIGAEQAMETSWSEAVKE